MALTTPIDNTNVIIENLIGPSLIFKAFYIPLTRNPDRNDIQKIIEKRVTVTFNTDQIDITEILRQWHDELFDNEEFYIDDATKLQIDHVSAYRWILDSSCLRMVEKELIRLEYCDDEEV